MATTKRALAPEEPNIYRHGQPIRTSSSVGATCSSECVGPSDDVSLLRSEEALAGAEAGALDLKRETAATLARYGADPLQPSFARNCLLARRLVERGTRFVSLFHASWDHHSNLDNELPHNCLMADQPVVALAAGARRMFGALAQQGINISMINTSEVCVGVVVERARGEEARRKGGPEPRW